jgi:glucose-1-phosphate adenylyltransferase
MAEDQADPKSPKDFGRSVVPRLLAQGGNIFAYPYGGYWIDVGTVDAFWEAHMDLLETPPSLNLNDRTWVIHTRSEERPPVRIEQNATIRTSLITDGAVIAEGATVERSVLSPGVYVGPGAVVRESVILNVAYIEAGAIVERSIIDKIVVVGSKAKVGAISDVGDLNIASVGKNTHIPPGYTVGAGSTLSTDLTADDFAPYSSNRLVPNGTLMGFQTRT